MGKDRSFFISDKDKNIYFQSKSLKRIEKWRLIQSIKSKGLDLKAELMAMNF